MFFPIIKKKKNNDIGTGNDFYLCLPAMERGPCDLCSLVMVRVPVVL